MDNFYFIDEDGMIMLTRGNVRVEWVNLGEGLDGDYDESNPSDVNLLRFDVSKFDGNEWTEVPDGSYCTQMPANSPHQVLKVGLRMIMDAVYDDVSNTGKAKKICESLSWIKPEDCVSA
jgi:hypothetical protein